MDKNKIRNYNYVIYKGTGGLIHMLCGLAYCLDWCQRNGHILIIDVISHQCYKHYLSDFFIISNEFKGSYNETYEMDQTLKFHRISVNDIKNYPNVEVDRGLNNNTHKYMLDRFNIRVGLDTYNRNDRIKVYAGPGSCKPINVLKYFKVKPEILKIITNHPPIVDQYIGVHFRNTDLKNNINEYINKIKLSCNNINTVYLATDDYDAVNIFKTELPDKKIIMYVDPYKSDGKPIHYANDDKYNLIINLLTDVYYLEKSTIFIDSPLSLVSKLIKTSKENKKTIFG